MSIVKKCDLCGGIYYPYNKFEYNDIPYIDIYGDNKRLHNKKRKKIFLNTLLIYSRNNKNMYIPDTMKEINLDLCPECMSCFGDYYMKRFGINEGKIIGKSKKINKVKRIKNLYFTKKHE